MTHVIYAKNVNHALPEALNYLRVNGIVEDSRNGPVLVAPGPVVTEYEFPEQRVLFCQKRDANPVFHLMESLWMFAGRSDVASLLPFNSNMANYAEEDGHIHGAYGARWKYQFGVDQIVQVINELKENPWSRQAVIGMWNPTIDLAARVKDKPCNTHIYLDLRGGKLNMTVCCRSNDMIWGAYGANVVHLSMLQQLIAESLGVELGVYRQFSNNFHIYTELPMAGDLLAYCPPPEDPYASGYLPSALLNGIESYWDFVGDCNLLWLPQELPKKFATAFFNEIVLPLHRMYLRRKSEGGVLGTWDPMPQMSDWRLAFEQWISRRLPSEGGEL